MESLPCVVGRTALLLAAKGGHTGCVELCLKVHFWPVSLSCSVHVEGFSQYAANLSLPDTSLMTTLHYAG